MKIPEGSFSAYLFDCDGTIADSLPLHRTAWLEALKPWGCDFPRELFLAWSGVPVPKTVELLNERFGLEMPPKVVAEAREAAYLRLLPEVRAVPEVLEQILSMHNKISFAVVSGSPRESVMRTLSFLGLLDKFPVIVGGDDTARGKPHPDPYLMAAQKLSVAPTSCLVFEDAELGIQSAEAAGMQWVRIIPRL